MANLIDRLGGFDISDDSDPGRSQIPVLEFWALLYEMSQGKVTRDQIISRYALSAAEQTQLDWLIGRYNAQPNATAKAKFVELVRVVLLLAEGKVPGYSTNADIVARFNAI